MQDQARIQNNPNVLAASERTPSTPAFSNWRDKEKSSRVLKTDAQPDRRTAPRNATAMSLSRPKQAYLRRVPSLPLKIS